MKDRIIELRRVPAHTLRASPKNWRTHPAAQREVLRGVLEEIGYAAALVARELPDGSLELIDGHLRAETMPNAIVPVLVVDVSAEEADKLLATLDPIGAMAGIDVEEFHHLLAEMHFNHATIKKILSDHANTASQLSVVGGRLQQKRQFTTDHELPTNEEETRTADAAQTKPPREVPIPTLFQLLVECQDECQQRELHDELTAAGYTCKVMTL